MPCDYEMYSCTDPDWPVPTKTSVIIAQKPKDPTVFMRLGRTH